MLNILWKRGEIAPQEQFLLLPAIFCYLKFDFCVKTGIRFSLRAEITEVEITRVDYICIHAALYNGVKISFDTHNRVGLLSTVGYRFSVINAFHIMFQQIFFWAFANTQKT